MRTPLSNFAKFEVPLISIKIWNNFKNSSLKGDPISSPNLLIVLLRVNAIEMNQPPPSSDRNFLPP